MQEKGSEGVLQARTSSRNGDPVAFFQGMVAPDAPIIAAGTASDMRTQAISQVIAATIEYKIRSVWQFRQMHLPNGTVLAPSRLFDWIAETAKTDGPPSQAMVEVPWEALRPQKDGSYVLPPEWAQALLNKVDVVPTLGGGFRKSHEGENNPDPPRLLNQYLYLIVPQSAAGLDSFKIHGGAIRLGGILDEVRRLAIWLSNFFRVWEDTPQMAEEEHKAYGLARVATFLLTGYAPLVPETNYPLPTGRGNHRQSPKHMQLAVFTAQHPGVSIRDRMENWNRLYPEWPYTQPTNFGWDSAQAGRRLIPLPIDPPSAPEPRAPLPDMAEWISRVLSSGAALNAAGERRLKQAYIRLVNFGNKYNEDLADLWDPYSDRKHTGSGEPTKE